VARSARAIGASPLVVTTLAAALAGCSTTQQEAARLQLNSARLRISQNPVRTAGGASQLRVDQISLVSGGGGSAVVVRLQNLSRRVISDLPISVGLTGPHGKRTYLNAQAGLDYFQTHIPALAPRALLNWVFTTGTRATSGERPFAKVGSAPAIQLPRISSLPSIDVSTLSGSSRDGLLRLAIRNTTTVPQYQLEVYATASGAGRYRAAGATSLEHLGADSSARIGLKLFGTPAHASVEVQAPPTIFG
jgi:hypothetical protein